jgi:hypothetical protein
VPGILIVNFVAMVKQLFFVSALLASFSGRAQEFKVEFDKNTDFSNYKTFTFGDGQIITPRDLRQIPDSLIHHWVRKAVTINLTSKGLTKVDGPADLVVSYLTGMDKHSDAGNVGPLGLTPGANPSQTYMRDYQEITLVVDVNDAKKNALLWRINARTSTSASEGERFIDQNVERGFRKFSLRAKKTKKK